MAAAGCEPIRSIQFDQHWTRYNQFLKQNILHPEFSTYVQFARTIILSGVDDCPMPIDKRKIIVLGPGVLEPLTTLADKCNELILVDYDEESLKQIAATLPEKKVRCIKLDLSCGLVDRGRQLFELKDLQEASWKDVLINLDDLYKNFKLKEFQEHPDLKDGDYVICSMMQIVFQVTAVFHVFLEDKFKKGIPYHSPLDKSTEQLHSLMLRHLFKRMGNMLRPGGVLFYSDKVAKRLLCPYVQKPQEDGSLAPLVEVMVPEKLLEEYEKSFRCYCIRSQFLLPDPSKFDAYEITLRLMKKNE